MEDDVIGPDKRLYNCTEEHTSTSEFDESKWERRGGIDDIDVDEFEAGLLGVSFDDGNDPQ